MAPWLDAQYVLPLRWPEGHDPALTSEMACYLAGSRRGRRRLRGRRLRPGHVRGAPARLGRPGRRRPARAVAGREREGGGRGHGVLRSRHERVVVADDDVRYDPLTLARVVEALDDADLVRPQNVFDPAPWHARWDTGRTLLNRALGADHPGTCAVRRSTFVRMGGYDGDVLFENLELARTVRRPVGASSTCWARTCGGSRPAPPTSSASGCGRPTTTTPSRAGS